jgi:hypothetical protein
LLEEYIIPTPCARRTVNGVSSMAIFSFSNRTQDLISIEYEILSIFRAFMNNSVLCLHWFDVLDLFVLILVRPHHCDLFRGEMFTGNRPFD